MDLQHGYYYFFEVEMELVGLDSPFQLRHWLSRGCLYHGHSAPVIWLAIPCHQERRVGLRRTPQTRTARLSNPATPQSAKTVSPAHTTSGIHKSGRPKV